MSKVRESVDLSIIVTAHGEGILAHKTMLSVFRSADKLSVDGYTYEIIIHIDKGSDSTINYFKKWYASEKNIRIIESDFGDLALSRNRAVEECGGSYITCIDADDLYSENWLLYALKAVKKQPEIIARVEYALSFGNDIVLTHVKKMSKLHMMQSLLVSNYFTSVFMCSRDIYLSHKQKINKAPYGFEDWQWTLDTIGSGYKHVAIPKTALFYRKDDISKTSLLASLSADRRIISQSSGLNFNYLKQLDPEPLFTQAEECSTVEDKTPILKEGIYNFLVYANTFKVYKLIKSKIRRSRYVEAEENEIDEQNPEIPKWLIGEWSQLNKIEKRLFPSKYILKDVIEWLPNRDVGNRYLHIIKELSSPPNTLFFVPWLVRGGADKVFINTVNELIRQHKDWKVAVLQTYDKDSVWTQRLDSTIDFINISKIMTGIGLEEQMRLLAVLVEQTGVERIIVGNSWMAYHFVARYKQLLRHKNIKIYSFGFCETISEYGRIGDFIHEAIPYVEEVIYKIVTDNDSIPEQLYLEHAINREQVEVVHQFIDNSFNEPVLSESQKIKVLWASRVNTQKLPGTLKDIGKLAEKNGLVIDVYGELEDGYTEEFFDNEGVSYKRSFNGIDDLPLNDYDVFIYTSSSDGMPNMLLEVASKGLPIVAPDVGGIKDLITHKVTGILVNDCYNAEEYMDGILSLKDPKERYRLAEEAQELLKERFSLGSWKKRIGEVFDK